MSAGHTEIVLHEKFHIVRSETKPKGFLNLDIQGSHLILRVLGYGTFYCQEIPVEPHIPVSRVSPILIPRRSPFWQVQVLSTLEGATQTPSPYKSATHLIWLFF